MGLKMAVNKHKPHVVLVPEDDKDRQIANGFRDYFAVATNRFDIRNVAGGWSKVLDYFTSTMIFYLDRHADARVILFIDFDKQFESRLKLFTEAIPDECKGRVYVIGSFDTPEELSNATQLSAEAIGKKLAEECDSGSTELWQHDHLNHNASELERLRIDVKPILFNSVIN